MLPMRLAPQIKFFPFLLVLYEITLYLSNDMYLPSMPAIAKDLHLTQDQTQNTLTLWFLGASSFQFLIGPISDRYGRKNIISIGGALFIISSLVCALTSDLVAMYAARFVQGSTICFIVVAGNAAIHESYSTKEAIKWLALLGAITILAPALGPLCGAIVVEFASWRDIFWFLVIMGCISFVLGLLFMVETNVKPHPLHIRTILRDYFSVVINKKFMLPCMGYCFLVGIFFFWMFESPFIIIENFNHSTMFYGLAQTCIFSIFFVGAQVTKWWLDRYHLYTLIRASTAITMIGVFALLITSILWNNIYLAIASMMFISLGASMLFGPINRIAIEASKEPMGRRIAVFSTAISVGGVICGWTISVVDASNLYALSVLITVCTILATLMILQTKIPRLSQRHA